MAEFTVLDVTRCSGGGHVHIDVQYNGRTITVDTTPEEIQGLLSDDERELRTRGLLRLVSAVKEAGATTTNQIRNALVGKTFKV